MDLRRSPYESEPTAPTMEIVAVAVAVADEEEEED